MKINKEKSTKFQNTVWFLFIFGCVLTVIIYLIIKSMYPGVGTMWTTERITIIGENGQSYRLTSKERKKMVNICAKEIEGPYYDASVPLDEKDIYIDFHNVSGYIEASTKSKYIYIGKEPGSLDYMASDTLYAYIMELYGKIE